MRVPLASAVRAALNQGTGGIYEVCLICGGGGFGAGTHIGSGGAGGGGAGAAHECAMDAQSLRWLRLRPAFDCFSALGLSVA
jgi:hypothetical protein